MEQHPVPQDITGFQFKLIGDMTVKQFVYLASGLLIAYIIFRLNILNFIKYPLMALFGGGGAALAFLDVDRRPLDRIIMSFFRSVYRDTRYIWKKSPQVPDILQSSLSVPTPSFQPPVSNASNRERLEEYLHSLPQKPKTNIDKIEEQKLSFVLSNFKNLPFKKTSSKNPAPSFQLPASAYIPPHPTPIIPLASGYKTDTVVYPGQKIHFTPTTNIRVRKLGAAPGATSAVPSKVPSAARDEAEGHPPISAKDYVVADTAGKLEKSTPLKKTVFVAPRPSTPPPLKPPTNPEEQKIFDLSQKNQALENQMKNIQAQVEKLRNEPLSPQTTAADFDRTLKNLLNSLQETERERKSAVAELIMLRRKLEAQKNVVSPSLAPDEKPSVRFVSPITAKRVGLPVVDYAPNVVNGIVIEPNGNVLSSVVMVVKDQKENPVRAFKSNKLGQFSIATPLPNGTYTVEVEKEGFDFDIIKLELKGEPLPPIEIKARLVPKPDLSQV